MISQISRKAQIHKIKFAAKIYIDHYVKLSIFRKLSACKTAIISNSQNKVTVKLTCFTVFTKNPV